MPLCGVPSWLVAHKHRILFCICEKRRWGKRGKRKLSQELTGQGEEGGQPQNKTIFKSNRATIFQSVILGNAVIEESSLRIIRLQFHFLMLIRLGLDF